MPPNNIYYQGQGSRPAASESSALPMPIRAALGDPSGYLADPGLVDACNVALMLGQPLLLTGEPGTGKTLFAASLSWELGLGAPLKFETKSDSSAQDLFYRYDALRRFRDAQAGLPGLNPVDYLGYNALGQAILFSQAPESVQHYLPPNLQHPGKKRSVVLIDEVDKAPRDFPNDILNELEHLYFRIPELDNAAIGADPALSPIIVITSNSEKDLPDAFLRRCIYYDIPFPDLLRLRRIVEQRLPALAGSDPFLTSALETFYRLRSPAAGLRKPPATAELLGWLIVLRQLGGEAANPLADPDILGRSLSTLVKTAADQEQARRIAAQWTKTTPTSPR
jgi:MoxR-like ATPase